MESDSPEGTGTVDSTGDPRAVGGTGTQGCEGSDAQCGIAGLPGIPSSGMVSHFRVLEFLGAGGGGRVFKALDLRLDRPVALKLLIRDDLVMWRRFRLEAHALARVEHPNICKIYEVGEVDGRPFIAMQLLHGEPLDRVAHRMTLEQRVKVLRDVAEAVHAVHRTGIIHRDVKPGNIMVQPCEDGVWRPYVVDFGLAREVEVGDLTRTGLVVGTPQFMAPEQAQAKPGLVDRRCDVYGLGATAYSILGGRPPFTGETAVQVILRLVDEEPPRLRVHLPTIPRDLETVVMKCLEKDPDRRYQSAKELADDLARFIDGEPVAARRASMVYRIRKTILRHRMVATVVAVAAVLVLTSVGIGIRAQWRSREREALAHALGQRVKEIESIMRIAHLVPAHDTRAEQARARQGIADIRRQMTALGSLGDGPGHHALGCGYLALQSYEEAVRHFELAWAAGHRTAATEYALGLALGELYRHLRREAARLPTELRQARVLEAQSTLRDPALAHLRAVAGSDLAQVAYAQGLIAFYEDRWDDAMVKAREAAAQLPFLYEAWQLQGDILVERARVKADSGDTPGAMEDFESAGELYASGLEIGRSDPELSTRECARRHDVFKLKVDTGHPAGDLIDELLIACRRAEALDPDRPVPYLEQAKAYWCLGDYLLEQGDDPRGVLEDLVEAASRAAELRPASARPHQLIGLAYRLLASYEMKRGEDPRGSFDRAISSLAEAVAREPDLTEAHSSLGLVHWKMAEYEHDRGGDWRPSIDHSIGSFTRGIETGRHLASLHSNLGLVRWRKASYMIDQGLDPSELLEEAVNSFRAALTVNRRHTPALSNLGNVYFARAAHQMSIGQDPTGSFEEAAASYREAIRIKPSFTFAYNNLGLTFVARATRELGCGRDPSQLLASARDVFAQALERNPNYAFALSNLGQTHAIAAEYCALRGLDPAGEVARAIEHFSDAIDANPRFGSPRTAIGDVNVILARHLLAEGQDLDRPLGCAHASLDEALRVNPQDTEALATVGDAEVLAARWALTIGEPVQPHLDRADAAIEQALAIAPDASDLHLARALIARWRAEALVATGRPARESIGQGLEAADRVLAENASSAEAHATRGALLLLAARSTAEGERRAELERQATAEMERAVELNPLLRREIARLGAGG